MSENTVDFLYDIMMTVLFIAALTLFFVIHSASGDTLKLLKTSISDERAVYESHSDIDEYEVSGAEIIMSIYSGLTTDIEVDGTFIPKDTDAAVFNFSVISPWRKYKMIYDMDTHGEIVQIVYDSI